MDSLSAFGDLPPSTAGSSVGGASLLADTRNTPTPVSGSSQYPSMMLGFDATTSTPVATEQGALATDMPAPGELSAKDIAKKRGKRDAPKKKKS